MTVIFDWEMRAVILPLVNLGVPVRKAETASEIVIVSRHLSPSIIGRVAVRGHLAGKAAIIDGPEELAMRLTKTFSFVGDVILDPFLGSGITTVAAWRFGPKQLSVSNRIELT